MINRVFIILSGFMFCLSCSEPKEQKTDKHYPDGNGQAKNIAQLQLRDSAELIHIKGQFYKYHTGQLFERTFADNDSNGVGSLHFVEYFNGMIPQNIDPLTFETLDGWYAKDKNFVYYYRPTSGGMQYVALEEADTKSFTIVEGQYLYAFDHNHVFKETEILHGINPQYMEIQKDKEGKIVSIKSGKIIFKADEMND